MATLKKMIQLPIVPPLKPRALFGICNALLDISADVTEEYLDRSKNITVLRFISNVILVDIH